MSFMNLTDNLLQDAYIIIFFFQKRVNNFKMLHMTMIEKKPINYHFLFDNLQKIYIIVENTVLVTY